jgi:ubiquinone/menaquinone biosynthesis C-methylase UbiE
MSSYSDKINNLLRVEPDPAFARRARLIFENLDLSCGQKILDAGCGRGFYLKSLLQLQPTAQIYGVDLNVRYLQSALKIIGGEKVTLVEADLTKLPFKDKFFDRIIASEILEHIKDDQKAIREIYRVLKPGGLILISVPCSNYPFLWDPVNWFLERVFDWHIPANIWWLAGLWADHVRLYRYDELAEKLSKAGFKIEQSWNSTRWCWPFSHFLFYGIGKNLVEKGFFPKFNRFVSSKQSFVNKVALFPLRLIDRLNGSSGKNTCCVNLVFKVSKPF